MAVKGLVIWAHSKCRSTFDLYREVVRQSPVPVKLVFRQGALDCRRAQGFADETFDAVPSVVIGENVPAAEAILAETAGWIHVVASYQVSPAFRHVMKVAHGRGDRVVVYSEAPCEMCVGFRALLKRIYYRWILPLKMRPVVRCADLILSQSGSLGRDRLLRMGWRPEQIVPFGYATAPLPAEERFVSPRNPAPAGTSAPTDTFRIVHLGTEAPYRGVKVLECAVSIAKARGANIVLQKTDGVLPLPEVVSAIRGADLVVACGLCEPWGMRVNDAIREGVPVLVSDGMGVSWLVQETGSGLIIPKGDAQALATALVRCATDRELMQHLKAGAAAAARIWTPAARAKIFLEQVLSTESGVLP